MRQHVCSHLKAREAETISQHILYFQERHRLFIWVMCLPLKHVLNPMLQGISTAYSSVEGWKISNEEILHIDPVQIWKQNEDLPAGSKWRNERWAQITSPLGVMAAFGQKFYSLPIAVWYHKIPWSSLTLTELCL